MPILEKSGKVSATSCRGGCSLNFAIFGVGSDLVGQLIKIGHIKMIFSGPQKSSDFSSFLNEKTHISSY